MSNWLFALALFGATVAILVVGTCLVVLAFLAFGVIDREYKRFRDGQKKIIQLHATLIEKQQEIERLKEQRAGYR